MSEPTEFGDLTLSVRDGTVLLHCPECGNEETHLEEILPNNNSLDGNKRLAVELVFSCEVCHDGENNGGFAVSFDQDKGKTWVMVECF